MIQKPKGTYDVYGNSGKNIKYIEKILEALMQKYNYEYVRTPIFEASNLYHRGVGETSDIVKKETYDFVDRGDRSMTLRPEGTAGVVRSYIENKRYADATQPVKCWYYGPMYRYERPQSGRFREFYQFGVEVFGSFNPILDAEVISIPVTLYKLLGLKGIKVKINSLGDTKTRLEYKEALLNHFKPYIDSLCSDCKERYNKNPLRILDCKVDHDKDCMKNAPKILDYLTEDAKKHFDKVKEYLELLEIPYEVDPNIVRGLDYYTNTVFEVEAEIIGFKGNNVLCGGGRYDKLVETLDGPETKAVGFALGFERLLNVLDIENINLDIDTLDLYIIPMSDNETNYAYKLCQTLRMNGFSTDIDYIKRNIKANFKQADRLNAKYIIIIGEEEIKNKILTIKDNIKKEEYKVKEEELIDFLDGVIEND